MNISPLIAIVPVVLAVALIIIVVRRNITERQPGEPIDIAGAIPAFVVLMVAVVFIGGMASSVAPYTWDEEDGELTINQDVGAGSQKWDSLGADVKSLVINDNVKSVADGAFNTLTGLEYVSISDRVESITSSAFGVTLKDCMDQAITAPEAGEYVGTGNGTLYYCDDSIYTYNSSAITGLTADAASAVHLVIPETHGGATIKTIASAAFRDKTAIATVLHVPGSELTTISYNAFRGCTSLATIELPETVDTIRNNAFRDCAMTAFDVPPLVKTIEEYTFNSCTSLTDIDLANVETIGASVFASSTSLSSITIPDSVTTIGGSAFSSCTSLASVTLSKNLAELPNYMFNRCTSLSSITIPDSVTSIGSGTFTNCSGITSVTFGTGLTTLSETTPFPAWTFYASDGTTQIDKTVAANLAGKTFQGTAAALVEVAEGQLNLTPDQIQQVQLHTQELQDLKDQISIDPLPFQPSLQTQEQEPVAA